MSKRFTDTAKWGKEWFRKLPLKYKVLWDYLCTSCNQIGVWDVDMETARHFVGARVTSSEALALFSERIVPLEGGRKWYLPGFVAFQYGVLVPTNNFHRSLIASLERLSPALEDAKKSGAGQGLTSPSAGDKDKDKDKDKGKDKREGLGEFDFEAIWKDYPRKLGKDEAYRHFVAQVNNVVDYANLRKALTNFTADLAAKATSEEYIPHGSTWFNHRWKDWINYRGATLPPPTPAPLRAYDDPGKGFVRDMTPEEMKEIADANLKRVTAEKGV